MKTGSVFLKKRVIGFLFAFIVIWACQERCIATLVCAPDSCKVAPETTAQRAIIAYRDGVETLIIESVLEGESGDYGLVIPVPAVPTKVEVGYGGLIETLSVTINPVVIRSLRSQAFYAHFVICLAIIATLLFILLVGASRMKAFVTVSIVLFLFVSLYFLIVPRFHKNIESPSINVIKGIDMLEIDSIGHHEIAIINVENSNDLAEWLTVNGYSKWSEEEANTASNYIKSGWHFVTVKFHKDKDGSSKVGPVAITFDSKQPVYPTCFLTNEGKDIYLELFVVTDTNQSANALGRGLHEGCWRFRYLENMKFKDDEYSCKKAFGNTTQLSLIGHPDSFNVMWDGCVVTKLCGNVGRKDLHSNIFFDYSSKENHTKYYSSRGAFVHSLIIGVFSWSALLVIATIFYQKWIQFAGRYAIKKILGIIILASALVFAGTFVYLPNVKTQSTSFHVRASCLVGNVEEIISPEMEIDEVRSILEKRIEQWRKGESYDACLKKIREFDSPGNYIIFEDERGVVVRVFYSGCRWKDIVTGELEDDAKTF